ncbi:MAG: hypothetical protein EPN85_10905 [Bacteroidetes bacterium]|nr:MAG: hypothetical protein EPN85_10905 [Bacteroidota bacterium]
MKRTIILSSLFAISFLENGFAQNIAINTSGNAADPSALLDVNATNTGILIPRVNLISNTDAAVPIASPATGLLVYNTNTSMTNGNGAGFYYWDGAKWTPLISGSSSVSGVTWPPIQVSNQTWASVTYAACVTNCANYTGTTAGDGGFTDWRVPDLDEYGYATLQLAAPTGGWLAAPPYFWTRSWWLAPSTYIVRENPFTSFAGAVPPYNCRCIR